MANNYGMLQPGTIPFSHPFGPPHAVPTTQGNALLLPAFTPSGQPIPRDQAISNYGQDGNHFGLFQTPDHASAVAQAIQARMAQGQLPIAAGDHPALQALSSVMQRGMGRGIV